MNKRLLKTTSIFASVTLVARTLGFLRDAIVAQVFGTTGAVDAIHVAIKLLGSLRGFIENPLSQIFVPILSEYKEKQPHEKVKQFIAATAGTLGFFMLITVIVGIFATPYLLKIIVPGFDPYRFGLANYFLRLTFPYLAIISFCCISVSVMNTYGQIWGAALTPIWLSLSLISTALFLPGYFTIPVAAQAWGVLIGGVLQVLFVSLFLFRLNLLSVPTIQWHNTGVQRVMTAMLPALLGASAGQVGMIITTSLASYLPTGTMSWITCADRLLYFPLSVVGISLSLAVLPALSKQAKNHEEFLQTLGWGIRCNLIFAVPAMITMSMLSGPLIISLFAYGKFNAFDVFKTQEILLGYAPGVPAFMMTRTLVAAFYAKQNTTTPVKIMFFVACTQIIAGRVMLDVFKFEQSGIALASSIAAWTHVSLLIWQLKQPISVLFRPPYGWKRWWVSLIGTVSSLVTFYFLCVPNTQSWFELSRLHRLLQLSGLGFGAMLITLFALAYNVRFQYRQLAAAI